ncbi:MAG TPA: ATP-binding SpoIIE family protein phosphatase [Steroidobacteraceae bacterium]
MTISDQSSVGECRRAARALAEANGFDEVSLGSISIVATEVATNILRHAGTGEVLIQMLGDGGQPELEILALDRGPGMADIDYCMRDGVSTGGTPGNGLGAVARLSSTFEVFTQPDQGTVLLSRTSLPSRATSKAKLQVGAICVAVAGEVECGDTWRVVDGGSTASMMVADGLGHGAAAATASETAAEAFMAMPFEPPSSLMSTLHGAASGTRGVAVACALAHADSETIQYAGVGNICGSVVIEGKQRGMVSHNGTLGVQLLRTRQFEYRWPPGSCIVMHSDGLSARWNLGLYPGLAQHHPAIIAGILYRDFARERDDATVIVVRRPR